MIIKNFSAAFVAVIVGALLTGCAPVAEARTSVPMYRFLSGEKLPDGSKMLRDNSYVPAPLDRYKLKGLVPLVLIEDAIVKSEFKRLGSGLRPVVLHRGEVVWVDPQPTRTWVQNGVRYGDFSVKGIFLCGNATIGKVNAPISKIERITETVVEKVVEVQEKAHECFNNTQNFAPVFSPTITVGGGGGGPQMVQAIPTIGQMFNTSSTGGVWFGGSRGSTFNVYAYGGNGYGAAAAAAAAAATSTSSAATPTSATSSNSQSGNSGAASSGGQQN